MNMRIAVAAIMLSGCSVPHDPVTSYGYPSGDIRVESDLGGDIVDRLALILRLEANGWSVDIHGQCLSSCTMFLGLESTCVYPEAVLGFHGPRREDGLGLSADQFERWSVIMATHYPARVREWFMSTARHSEELSVIRGSFLIDEGISRSCE